MFCDVVFQRCIHAGVIFDIVEEQVQRRKLRQCTVANALVPQYDILDECCNSFFGVDDSDPLYLKGQVAFIQCTEYISKLAQLGNPLIVRKIFGQV